MTCAVRRPQGQRRGNLFAAKPGAGNHAGSCRPSGEDRGCAAHGPRGAGSCASAAPSAPGGDRRAGLGHVRQDTLPGRDRRAGPPHDPGGRRRPLGCHCPIGITKDRVTQSLRQDASARRRRGSAHRLRPHRSGSVSGVGLASAGDASFTMILTVWASTLPLADLTS